ncbi:hypothetical protein Bca4012_048366 [Brassica carinata]
MSSEIHVAILVALITTRQLQCDLYACSWDELEIHGETLIYLSHQVNSFVFQSVFDSPYWLR